MLGALQPRWAASADVAADDAAPPDWEALLPGWRRDVLLTSRAADLRAAPRALCAALRLVPDTCSAEEAAATSPAAGVLLRPAVGANTALPAGCAVRLAPRGADVAELTLQAPRRCDGLRLARHVAAAMPADVASAPNAAAPPALAAAAAAAEALREELRARIAAAEGQHHRGCAPDALAAQSCAALAALLLATAQD